MLKRMVLMTMSVFGAASMAVAGTPITTMSVRPMTVKPELHKNAGASTRTNAVTAIPRLRRPERLPVQVRKPEPNKVGASMTAPGPKSRTQPGIRRLPGHKGMVFSGRRQLRPITLPNLEFVGYQPGLPNNNCADLRKLMVILRATVVNSGGPLSAHRAKIYLRETNGAHLYSPEIPIPPLVPDGQVNIVIPVGTTEAYRGKLPGVHHLNSYLVEDGKVTKSIDVSFGFPKGYCQPKTISVTHGKMPDLIPQVSDPFSGIINVKNIGGSTAGASKLTVSCKKLGGGPGGDCPSTPALDAVPTDSSGALLISVPALSAGQVHTIHLPVQGLKWDLSKDYRFTYKADATHAVAESNEKNNTLVTGVYHMHKVGTGSATHGKMPDLIPQVSNPFGGIINVKNIGDATAGASKLTVNCKKLGSGFAASTGDCPSTPALDALPADPSGALLIPVPALSAGQTHKISGSSAESVGGLRFG